MVTVVGIGADGWAGLPSASRDALGAADVVLGSARQLGLLPTEVAAERVPWPSPLLPALPGLVEANAGRRLCVLASGDPMWFGIGVELSALTRVDVLPHPSSASLACARLGWALQDVEVVSAVGRPVERLHAAVHPGRRVLVLSASGETPAAVAALLRDRGFGPSALTVLSDLGGPTESAVTATAESYTGPAPALNVVAVECVAGQGARRLPRVPGLPDDVFEHDGQITKREVRAVTLAALAPEPGELLWDIGAGSGSVGIEWLRAHPACRAVGVEPRPDRAARAARNAAALGVPHLDLVIGSAPDVLSGLPRPDAVFVGGGATAPGLLPACWTALAPGGRLVVNAVTLESESLVTRWHGEVGGTLTRIAVDRAGALGGFTAWQPQRAITQWRVAKEEM
ncbi:precorrin-6y C5,15-methyltransferase (decarboxylating) subunit CbiE [Actinokineospora fastidiosa]|uniref:Precorrin-6Y C5,15-methyltransferase n=1 Tax=Actinokineospora fastidiosa TaxID=1816 RepID=A0A918GNJ5_9PSEU|nr:precorrin-6y C5,15-methyltransferase (decarboxylating) subunit CbiE [Actinokineospora fastidiosa]GGS47776.1 precorrin-6Y C5,15-methyltransferase [Actinokineospora fastidiosa]